MRDTSVPRSPAYCPRAPNCPALARPNRCVTAARVSPTSEAERMSNVIVRANAARAANLAMALRATSFVESQTGMREASARIGAAPSPDMLEAWAQAALRDGRSDCGALSALAFMHLRDAWK